MTTKGERINAAYEGWFKQLQSLTSVTLNPDDWTGRWHNGFTPADALEEGPDEDAQDKIDPAEVRAAQGEHRPASASNADDQRIADLPPTAE